MSRSPVGVRARWVVPVDQPPIENGAVAWSAGRLVEVGKRVAAPCTDLGEAVVLPGLVNAHAHLEFSDAASPVGTRGMPLPAWIREVISLRKAKARDPEAAIDAGRRESLAWGVTTIGEIATSARPFAWSDEPGPNLARFHEVIGFSAPRGESALRDAIDRLARFAAAPAGGDAIRFAEGLSPHAPYTVHPQLLARLTDLAAAEGRPMAMHLAESPEELELLAEGAGPFRELLEEKSMWDPQAIPRGSRPLDYLRVLARAPRVVVVHGNYLDDEEIAFLAARRGTMTVAACPRTHAYFGHAPHPLAAMLRAGVRVALGTDSRASSPNLDLLAECRAARAAAPRVAPDQLLRMATLDAAEALGCDDCCGSLTPGKRADLLAIRPSSGCRDPWETLFEDVPAACRTTWVAGRRVVPLPDRSPDERPLRP